MTSGYAIATLVVFIVSIFFVICPVSIPTPRPISRIPINLTTAPILAIAILWAAQCIDPVVIRNGIVGTEGVKPYNIIILFFSLAYMAVTLDITGILQSAAFWVSNKGGHNGWKQYFYFYVLLTLLSILMGNDAVILSGTPFLVYYTAVAKLNPRAWVMAEFATANTASMVLFVGNITNVVVCEGFSVNNVAFSAYTIVPFIACNLSCFAALAFQYRKQVSRTLEFVAHKDPRSVLLDPVGACVGSFMLIMTLILCLVVSFFGIEVWVVSLPFALGKFVFDLIWDHYRYSRGIPMLGRGSSGSVGDGLDERSDIPLGNRESTAAGLPRASESEMKAQQESTPESETKMPRIFKRCKSYMDKLYKRLDERFPTLITALPRLPFALVPFSFSQFILVEALNHQGWVEVFGQWLVRASRNQLHPTIWLIGVIGVVLCNLSGTNIGATILLTQVVRAAALRADVNRAAAISLAIASNIGAVSFTFSASLAGLLWRGILKHKNIHMKQLEFAFWNLLPLLVMTGVGFGVLSLEMMILYQ